MSLRLSRQRPAMMSQRAGMRALADFISEGSGIVFPKSGRWAEVSQGRLNSA